VVTCGSIIGIGLLVIMLYCLICRSVGVHSYLLCLVLTSCFNGLLCSITFSVHRYILSFYCLLWCNSGWFIGCKYVTLWSVSIPAYVYCHCMGHVSLPG
jgi:hypothetical protein